MKGNVSMIFISNKYYNIYYNIINKAISRNFRSRKEAKKILGYVEQHHVLPRSLGGDDSRNNTVYLTAREHFICHLLLVRMTTYPEKRSMIFALQNFIHRKKDKLNDYKINSHRYALLRELASKEMSKLHKGKTSWNKGLKQDEKSNKKRSLSLKGKTHTEEHRLNVSLSRRGDRHWLYGKQQSDSVKEKLRTS
jgi:hypothetical protein